MKHTTEPYNNVPELRQELFEDWYEESWPDQENAPGMERNHQVLTQVAELPGKVSHLIRPIHTLASSLLLSLSISHPLPPDAPIGEREERGIAG